MPLTYGTKEWDEAYETKLKERLENKPKPFVVGTPEWVHELKEVVNKDEAYKNAAKTWEYTITLEVGAKPEYGIDEDVCIFLDIWHGECRSARILPKEEAHKAHYVFSGTYETWKSVAKLEKDTMKLVVQGEIKLKGDLARMMKYVKAAKRLAELSGVVEGVWPDELPAAELEKFKEEIKELRAEFGV